MEVITAYFGSVTFIMLTVILQVLVALCGAGLVALIRKANKKLGIEVSEKMMDSVMTTVQYSVKAINQKLVNDLKELSPDGKLSEAQKKKIFDTTKETILAGLTSEEVEYLMNKYTDFDLGIETLIENCVVDCKSTVLTSDYTDEYAAIETDTKQDLSDDAIAE